MTRRIHSCQWLLVFYLLLAADLDEVGGSTSSVSLSSQTANGYDRLMGTDAICWASQNSIAANSNIDDPNNNNPLGVEFSPEGPIQLLRECPEGNTLQASAPQGIKRFRTGTRYEYHAEISLNLTSLGGGKLLGSNNNIIPVVNNRTDHVHLVSETRRTYDNPKVAVSVIACGLGLGLCTPFAVQDHQAATTADAFFISSEHHVTQGPWEFLELARNEGPVYTMQMDIPVTVNSPGQYFVIIGIQLYLGDHPSAAGLRPSTRIDMANTLQHHYEQQKSDKYQQQVITYQEPPVVLEGSAGVRYGSYAAIAVSAAVILWLLSQVIVYRNTRVLQITQGRFLAVFLFAGFIATVASFLLEPLSDGYCQWGFPIVISSLQLFFAITVGRVWRIYAIVSPAMMKIASRGDKHEYHWIEKLLFEPLRKYTSYLVRIENKSRPTSMHKAITDAQLVMVVAIFTIPQIILQLLAALLQPRQLMIDWNDENSVGRQYCAIGNDIPGYASVFYYGLALFVLLLVILLIMAQATRHLPSLFNESKDLFDSVLSSLFLVLLGIAVTFGTASPTTTPSVEYVVCVVVILCATLQASLRLMIPKLKMAWNREEVIVSELVCEHSRMIRQKQRRQSLRFDNSNLTGPGNGTGSGMFSTVSSCSPTRLYGSSGHKFIGVSGLDAKPQAAVSKMSNCSSADDSSTPDDSTPSTKRLSDKAGALFDEDPDTSTTSAYVTSDQQSPGKVQFLNDVQPRPQQKPEQTEKPMTERVRNRRPMVVSSQKPPDWRLVLKMMDLENNLQAVNKKIMSGRSVGKEEWEQTRSLSSRMGAIFVNNIVFEWEKNSCFTESSRDLEDFGQHPDCDRMEYYSSGVQGESQGEVKDDESLIDYMNKSMNNSMNKSYNSRQGHKLPRRSPREKLLDHGCCVGVRDELGEGPARFAPDTTERSIKEQALSLSKEELDSLLLIRTDWKEEQQGRKKPQMLTDEMILRFYRDHSGSDAESHHLAAWRAMKQFDFRYMSLTAANMEEQLLSKTLFPVPGVKTIDGSLDVFYMRPCRFDPRVTPTSVVIDNLVYCMSTMLEKESTCTNGIGFIACMDSWTMKHFNIDYCFQFMQGLQGKITPVKVMLFLIVNPPPWFGKVWAMMKPMLSADFQKKVKMIPEADLPQYLAPGYEQFLPDDMCTGDANTDQLVLDWIAYRTFLEADDGVVANDSSYNYSTTRKDPPV